MVAVGSGVAEGAGDGDGLKQTVSVAGASPDAMSIPSWPAIDQLTSVG